MKACKMRELGGGICIYIYIQIYTEREREIEGENVIRRGRLAEYEKNQEIDR